MVKSVLRLGRGSGGGGNNALLVVLVPLRYALDVMHLNENQRPMGRDGEGPRLRGYVRRGAAAWTPFFDTPPSNTGVNKQLWGRTGVNMTPNKLTPMVITGITLR